MPRKSPAQKKPHAKPAEPQLNDGHLIVRLPSGGLDRLREWCAKNDTTMSALVRKWIARLG